MATDKSTRRRRSPQAGDRNETRTVSVPSGLMDKIEQWADEACIAHEVELVDVEVSASGRPLLRVFAQRPGNPAPGKGITIDECAQVSRFLEAMLDAEDTMPENYILEVSSPGIERPLKKLNHFEQVKGSKARVVLKKQRHGQNALEGEVLGADLEREVVLLKLEGQEDAEEIGWPEIKKAHVVFDFSG